MFSFLDDALGPATQAGIMSEPNKTKTRKPKRRRMSIEKALRLSLELDRQVHRPRSRSIPPPEPAAPLSPAEIALMPFV